MNRRTFISHCCLTACVVLPGPTIVRAVQKQQINWLTFEQLSDSLVHSPKKVLISFYTDWCVYCHKMHREVFTNPEVVRRVNAAYYAVKFDAESTDAIHFDGQLFLNRRATKRRKGFHDIALLLGSRNGQFNVPVTLLLDPDFRMIHRSFQYLDSKKLLELL
nr:thioredoxin fold domain-containing protein [Parapedobacter lycopersici]